VNETEEKTALLARWKARLEAAGKGFPTDVDLIDLMDRWAELVLEDERELQDGRDKENSYRRD
jgi:hypothetical protein